MGIAYRWGMWNVLDKKATINFQGGHCSLVCVVFGDTFSETPSFISAGAMICVLLIHTSVQGFTWSYIKVGGIVFAWDLPQEISPGRFCFDRAWPVCKGEKRFMAIVTGQYGESNDWVYLKQAPGILLTYPSSNHQATATPCLHNTKCLVERINHALLSASVHQNAPLFNPCTQKDVVLSYGPQCSQYRAFVCWLLL